MANIHPTAIIDPNAVLGRDVRVGPYTIVGPDVVVGDGCIIENHVTLTGCTKLGSNVQIFPGAVVGGAPQDLKYRGEKTKLLIGENTMIRECATLHVGTELGGGETVIGSDNLIMAYVHVAHDCRLGNRIVIANGAQLAGHVHVEDGARISGLVAVHHFVTIGTCSFTAGCAKLSIDVPPFTLAEGHPAKIRALNREGIKRRSLTEEAQLALKETFRLCYRSELPQDEAFRQVADRGYEKFTEVAVFVEFLRATSRGKHGRALESQRAVVPAEQRDGRLNFKPGQSGQNDHDADEG
jgi:UDP-N-acetylglucosamine acyltransferase